QASAADVAAPPASPAAPAEAQAYNTKWVLTQDPETYVIQLFGVRDRAAAQRFVRSGPGAGRTTVVDLELDGAPWHVVVYGHYPDRAAAVSARDALPDALGATKPWPRSVGSLVK
ncbi:MAG: SPOR domain-containing protein, partial [Gammaproteobacteria bacterium]